MPTYQYACTECGEQLEKVQKFTEEPLTVCPVCNGRLRKVFSPVGIVFKGSGFYRTDSRSGNGAKDGGRKEDASEPASAGSGSKAEASGDKSGKSDSGDKSGQDKKAAASASSKDSSSSSSGSSPATSSGSTGEKVA